MRRPCAPWRPPPSWLGRRSGPVTTPASEVGLWLTTLRAAGRSARAIEGYRDSLGRFERFLERDAGRTRGQTGSSATSSDRATNSPLVGPATAAIREQMFAHHPDAGARAARYGQSKRGVGRWSNRPTDSRPCDPRMRALHRLHAVTRLPTSSVPPWLYCVDVRHTRPEREAHDVAPPICTAETVSIVDASAGVDDSVRGGSRLSKPSP